MNYIRLKHDSAESEEELLQHEAPEFDKLSLEMMDGLRASSTADITPWMKAAVRAVAFAESRSARIIGITGIRKGAGSSSIAEAIARAYSEHGKRILFVRASEIQVSEHYDAAFRRLPDFVSHSMSESTNLFHIDLSRLGITYPQDPDLFRDAFETALESFHAIVVDLPCAGTETGQPEPASLAMGASCPSALLVCVTGRTTRAEIQQCLASCKISGTNVEGIVLNDFQLPMNSVLSRG
jgi:Mrp family chromosome partitioning ATPase